MRLPVLLRLSPGAAAAYAVALVLAAAFFALLEAGAARAVLSSPPATPIIEDRDGNFLAEGEGSRDGIGYWDVDGPLNERLVTCMTAIEDRRFYRHPGVDARSLLRSVLNNTTGGDRQGGSTIAMQVARMQRPA
ncbi:MAG TPA: transglycosylase domain-containing protein, partial [Spirochaetia bacterium]